MPVEDPEPLIGAVKFFTRLDLDQIILFVDGHYLKILKFAYLNGNFKCAAGGPAILTERHSVARTAQTGRCAGAGHWVLGSGETGRVHCMHH